MGSLTYGDDPVGSVGQGLEERQLLGPDLQLGGLA